MPTCVIMLGVPGSKVGETAKYMADVHDATMVSPDDKFLNHDAHTKDIKSPHDACLLSFDRAMHEERNVVVNEENSKWTDIRPYLLGAAYRGYNIIVQEPYNPTRYIAEECVKNTSGVTLEEMDDMIKGVQLTRARVRTVLETLFDPKSVKNIDKGIQVTR
jgi:hypothetical protein